MHSLIFRTAAHMVTSLMLVFSLYLLLRGHNESGGGFIGALIAVIACALLMLAESPRYITERLHYYPLSIAFFGASMALISGLVAVIDGQPYLTGIWWKSVLPLGTPLLFDVGVYLAIIGSVLAILVRIRQEID